MNVLIVDDQANVVSSLKSGINWDMLGVKNIYTALNALEAREIIARYPIDILLSDIEMPVENGLSLLRWCRNNNYLFECIFLTSHADFFYAKEAIQLGSFDYILQPARYEDVENAVKKAILRIEEGRKEKAYTDYGKAAMPHKNLLMKGILHDWLTGNDADMEKALETLKDMDIILKPDSPVHLLWLQILSWSSQPLDFSIWSVSIENIFKNIFSYNNCRVLSYCPDKLSMEILIYGDNLQELAFDIYQTNLNIASCQITETLSCNTAFYTAPSCRVRELSSYAKAIRHRRSDNVLLAPGIFITENKESHSQTIYCDIEMLQRFELYMANNQASRAEKEALQFLYKLNDSEQLCHDTLDAFCRDYQQAAYSAAHRLNLPAHILPLQRELLQQEENSSLTLDCVIIFIKKLTAFFQSIAPVNSEDKDSFTIIMEYIHDNLDKPLLRSDIARAVFLSPDYITRLLRENGISLKDYVTEEKMKTAKNLLLTTTLPISLVAAKVGYDNFSHFSKIYKKVMGITPSAERNMSD